MKTQHAILQPKIPWALIAEEFVAIQQRSLIQLENVILRRFTVLRMPLSARPLQRPIQPPFKMTNHAIGGAVTQSVFPGTYPAFVCLRHRRSFSEYSTRTRNQKQETATLKNNERHHNNAARWQPEDRSSREPSPRYR